MGGRWHASAVVPLTEPHALHIPEPQVPAPGRAASAGPRPGTSFPRGLASLRRHLWHRENSVPTAGNRHTSALSKVWSEACRVDGAQGEGSVLSPIRMWVLALEAI